MMCDQHLIFSKRCRTRFSSWQIDKLEKIFIGKTHYPDSRQTEMLSQETGIPIAKMQIWFQNRRAKWRKHSRLKNFGGLGRVNQSEFVPAPNEYDTIKSLQQLSNNIVPSTQYTNEYSNYFNSAMENQKLCKEKQAAIDLSISSTLKASAALSSSCYSSFQSPSASSPYPLSSSFYLIPSIPITMSTPMPITSYNQYNDKSQSVFKQSEQNEESHFSNHNHMNEFEYHVQQQQTSMQTNGNENSNASTFASSHGNLILNTTHS